jgi:small subunit ribosomal protein S19e
MSYHDVPADPLIHAVASELKKSAPEIKQPSWGPFVKTGVDRQRPPTQKDWWHVRAAAMLRRIAIIGPVGTSKLRKHYGGAQNRGHQPETFKPGSGNVTRKILQQLEKAGLVKQGAKGVHKGRMITPKAHSMLDKASDALMKHHNIIIPRMPTAEQIQAATDARKAANAVKPAAKKPVKKVAPAAPVETPANG